MQNRLAHQRHQFLEDIFAVTFGRIEDGGQRRIGARSPLRAETAHDFAMDHRGAQGALADIVIRRDIGPIQEHEQMLAMGSIACQQIQSVLPSQGTVQQPIQAFLQAGALSAKALGRQRVTPMVEAAGGAEQVLQFPGPEQARPLLDQPLQVAHLMLQAELMRLGRRIQLRGPTITQPDYRPVAPCGRPDTAPRAVAFPAPPA